MDDINKQEFLEHFTGLCEIFGKDASKVFISMYFEALKEFTIEQVKESISKSITNNKFFPKPVELIQNIKGTNEDIENIALIQADLTLKAIGRHGKYKSVSFKDKTTQAVISRSFGGWINLCQESMENEEKWFRKDFIKAYIAYKNGAITDEGYLTGISEHENNSRGIEYKPEIISIGDGIDLKQLSEGVGI